MATDISDLLNKQNNSSQEVATESIPKEEKLDAQEFQRLVQAVQENQKSIKSIKSIKTDVAKMLVQNVAFDVTESAATLTIKQQGYTAKTVSVPVATDKHSGIITAADKRKLDDMTAYEQATATQLGVVKLYDDLGVHRDGAVTQAFLSRMLEELDEVYGGVEIVKFNSSTGTAHNNIGPGVAMSALSRGKIVLYKDIDTGLAYIATGREKSTTNDLPVSAVCVEKLCEGQVRAIYHDMDGVHDYPGMNIVFKDALSKKGGHPGNNGASLVGYKGTIGEHAVTTVYEALVAIVAELNKFKQGGGTSSIESFTIDEIKRLWAQA